MAVAEKIARQVRSLTTDEVMTFIEQGWVKLPGLISPELAEELLGQAKDWLGADGAGHASRPGIDNVYQDNAHYGTASIDDERFGALARARQLGENAAVLLGRDSPIKLWSDSIDVKLPASKNGQATGYHQDHSFLPFDRCAMTFWIALDEVTPDQGPLRFFEGSHRLGPLGRLATPPEEMTALWPSLAGCNLSPGNHLLPGDATAHTDGVLHGAPLNRTDDPRWAYVVVYYPSDTLYTKLPSRFTDELGLVPFQAVDHPNFPLVYTPEP